jgi:hypothetical protein
MKKTKTISSSDGPRGFDDEGIASDASPLERPEYGLPRRRALEGRQLAEAASNGGALALHRSGSMHRSIEPREQLIYDAALGQLLA